MSPTPTLTQRARRLRIAFVGLSFAVAFTALVALKGAHAAVDALSTGTLASVGLAAGCIETTTSALVQADSWVDENSPLAMKGSDSILSVDGGSLNVDTGLASGRARALVRFQLPQAIPEGCVLESATLQLFSSEQSAGTKVEVARLASAWSEDAVSWSNHPRAIGAGVTIWSRDGYMHWNVTAQVEAMLEAGNHGFLIRDAAEASEAGGGGHGFYSREKGENPAQLVIRFAPPPSDEPPGPPSPPSPAAVTCGEELTESTLVTNDLFECSGDGLVIGAPRIIVDLGGHTIDGVGLGSGVRNAGHASVTVRNGTVQEFDYGVNLLPETELNLIERLTLRHNEVGAVELFDVAATEVRENVLDENGGGISLVSGTSDALVTGNTVTANGKAGLLVRDSDRNRLENNSVSGGGDLGIGLERATGNTLVGNTVSENSDGAIELRAGSHGNRVENNNVTDSGDHGILVDDSDRNELISNRSHLMSDSGITLESANDGVIRGNDVRFNTGGLQVDGSSRNMIEANDASNTSGIGIELGGGSFENTLVGNVADENGSTGILVADDAADPLGVPVPGLGNLLVGNVADRNRSDGIVVAKGGHTITANIARSNAGWGINAALNSIDGGLNVASGNAKPEQCAGVVCKVEWNPQETTITGAPPAATSSSSATFLFTGSDDTTSASELRFECRLDTDESGWASCSSPRSYTGLAPGSHVFDVRSIDAFDNVDATPARHAWTVDATPPETTIESGPDAETASTAASFVFSADEPGGTFACSLDRGPFESCASPTLYAEIADGRHEFRVYATDPAGNSDATPASHTWTVDATPPETKLEAAPAVLTNSTSATFSFSSGEAGASFACSLDGAPFEPCQSPHVYTVLADGEHTFEVRASDRVGNVDATPASDVWTVDTTPPETAIGSGPTDSSSDVSPSFAFSSEHGASFACRLDGGEWLSCSSPQGYGDLTEGRHELQVRASDSAGNTDASPAIYSWTVDTLAPETTIEAAPPETTQGTSASFRFSASDRGAQVECALDGAPFAACVSPVELAGLSVGSHVFAVRAIDAAGNVDPSPASYSWNIVEPSDTTAPETSIDAGPHAFTTSTSAVFAFSASELGARFECALDGSMFLVCASPLEYMRLEFGAHRFEVRAADSAGNMDATPAIFEWTVVAPPDTTAPETVIDSGPPENTVSREATLRFSSEPEASFECSFDSEPFAACVSPVGLAGVSVGSHVFAVRAIDAAGNVDASPASYGWSVVEPPDTTAPETVIDSGPDANTVSTTAVFAFSASELGARFECTLDGGAFLACGSPAEYAGLAPGAHRFEVRATDEAGNTDTSPAFFEWTIVAPPDSSPPETAIDSGPEASTTSTDARFEFSATELGAQFECALDGAAFAACASPQGYAELALGAHRFEVRAIDAAGNSDPSPARHEWMVVEPPDVTAPETLINSAPETSTTSVVAEFVFSANELGARFECALDGAAFAACGSPATYAGLAFGAHHFEVRATDEVGNVDTSPAFYAWTVVAPPDVSAPETAIGSGPAAETISTSAVFTFSASELGARFACALDGAPFAACLSPQAYAGLALGLHQFEVRATDAAGNTDATPAVHAWRVVVGSSSCPSITLVANADSWVDENSPANNFGSDSILKLRSKEPRDNFRALVGFALPAAIPQGCRVGSASLRLLAASATRDRVLHALRLVTAWSESLVTWNTQPQTLGDPAATASGLGARVWDVTTQVQAMFDSSAPHGFLIRDAAENADAEQSFHSREKGESPPQLTVIFAPVGG